MNLFRVALAIAWIVIIAITIHAFQTLGLDGANVFVSDFAYPWRAQFNTDFSIHVLLLVTWILYREPKLWVGVICAVLAAMCGSAFSLAYIFVTTFRADGDTRKLLLGGHAIT